MEQKLSYPQARALLLDNVTPVDAETLPLERCGGRVLARNLTAQISVPPFDRSPYDGYAFRAGDSAAASRENPVTLRVLEELPAGATPTKAVTAGTAVRLMTGAPIPPGADAVVMFEKTSFTPETVTLFAPAARGENVVRAGEDVPAGGLLALAGTVIDAGLAGTMGAQGVLCPPVYRQPKVGVISTGSELVELGQALPAGKIYNSNRYTLTAAAEQEGCTAVYLGTARDSTEEIAALVETGLADCDMVLLTGGVSVGDYDLTPAAMERCGVRLLARGVDFKPGMACAYGVRDGKLVCGLSGNPASALTNYYAVVRPALRRLAGREAVLPPEFDVALSGGFPKKSKSVRLLRGMLRVEAGRAVMLLPEAQGNVVLSSAIGCDMLAVIPAGSGPLPAGTVLKGFLL